MYPHGETVTIHHPGTPTEDPDYGTPIPGATTDEDITGVAVAPGDTRENTDRQATLAVAYTLYFDKPVLIEHNAQVTVRGDAYEVDGKPLDWRNPYTGFMGLEAAVGRSQ
jgi:hypothetical protein